MAFLEPYMAKSSPLGASIIYVEEGADRLLGSQEGLSNHLETLAALHEGRLDSELTTEFCIVILWSTGDDEKVLMTDVWRFGGDYTKEFGYTLLQPLTFQGRGKNTQDVSKNKGVASQYSLSLIGAEMELQEDKSIKEYMQVDRTADERIKNYLSGRRFT